MGGSYRGLLHGIPIAIIQMKPWESGQTYRQPFTKRDRGRGPLLWRRGSFDKRTHHNPSLGGKKQVGLPSTANSTASTVPL
jgi:hypothetical protein